MNLFIQSVTELGRLSKAITSRKLKKMFHSQYGSLKTTHDKH